MWKPELRTEDDVRVIEAPIPDITQVRSLARRLESFTN